MMRCHYTLDIIGDEPSHGTCRAHWLLILPLSRGYYCSIDWPGLPIESDRLRVVITTPWCDTHQPTVQLVSTTHRGAWEASHTHSTMVYSYDAVWSYPPRTPFCMTLVDFYRTTNYHNTRILTLIEVTYGTCRLATRVAPQNIYYWYCSII